MAITKSDKVARPALTPTGADCVVAVEAKAVMAAAATDDIVVGFVLPADCVPVDLFVASDDLDTGAAITLTAAVLKDDFSDIVADTEFFVASTVAQAGGVVRADNAKGLRLANSASDRWIGLKVAAGAGAFQAGTITIHGTYRAAYFD